MAELADPDIAPPGHQNRDREDAKIDAYLMDRGTLNTSWDPVGFLTQCICQTKDNCTPGSEVFIASRSKRPPENVNPYPELEERPRRKGRLASQVMSQSTYLGPGPELLLNAPPGPNQKRAAKVRHTTDQLDPKESEYTPCEYDEAGEKKVTPTGILEGGRQYKCTFHVPGSGDKLFMLATDCA